MKKLIFLVFSCCIWSYTSQAQEYQVVSAGVWRLQVGKPEKVTLLSAAAVRPKMEAIQAMGDVPFPLNKNEIRYEVREGKTFLRFPLAEGEKIFGLGLNFQTVEQRGHTLRLHVDHYGSSDNGRTHAPVPFYVSSNGYGVLINAARYIDVWVGTGVRQDSKHPPVVRNRITDTLWSPQPYSDNLEVLVPAEGAEILFFGGPTALDAVRRFNLYNGGGCLPTKWGLGFWHRTPANYSDKQVVAEVAEFEKRGFPLSVLGLEPGWQTWSYPCTYEWSPERFPNPRTFISGLKQKGVQVNIWLNPYLAPQASLYPKIKPLSASHTVWTGIVPDYASPETNRIIGDFFNKTHLDVGVSGYKMDENDGFDTWLWPDVATFPSGVSAEQMRQTYPVLMQKMATDLYRARNIRTFGLVRGSNAGASSFPYVLYSDYYKHRDYVTALINSSFIGVLWSPEVREAKTAEEWIRRMQSVMFSPVAMLNAWMDGTKPWSFPEVEKQVKELINLRMQLLPYFYTCFAEYAFKGSPVVRAMNLEEGFRFDAQQAAGKLNSTDNPYPVAIKSEIKDQFMVGDNLLVAPMFTGQTEREVILPKGKWFDFYTGKMAGEGEVITVKPGLDKIPVFVRDGGIIPMMPVMMHTPANGQKTDLEVRFYGAKDSAYQLYDDDGETYDYEKGAYSWREIKVMKDKNGKLAGTIAKATKGKPDSIGKVTFRFMTN